MISLNNDGQQFHQYQQNEKSQKDLHTWFWQGSWCLTPLSTIFQLYGTTYDVGYQDSGLGQAQKCDCVKSVNGNPTLLFTTGSNGNTCLMSANDDKSVDLLPLKKTTYYHKNEWQHEHGQYDSRVNECL